MSFIRFVLVAKYNDGLINPRFEKYYCTTCEKNVDMKLIVSFLDYPYKDSTKFYDHPDDVNFYVFEITRSVMFVTGVSKLFKNYMSKAANFHDNLSHYFFKTDPSKSQLKKKVKELIDKPDLMEKANEKISRIRKQMVKNVDSILERQTKLETLEHDAFLMDRESSVFKKSAKKTKFEMIKKVGLIGGIVGGIVGGVAGGVAGGVSLPVTAALGATITGTVATGAGLAVAGLVGGTAIGAIGAAGYTTFRDILDSEIDEYRETMEEDGEESDSDF